MRFGKLGFVHNEAKPQDRPPYLVPGQVGIGMIRMVCARAGTNVNYQLRSFDGVIFEPFEASC